MKETYDMEQSPTGTDIRITDQDDKLYQARLTTKKRLSLFLPLTFTLLLSGLVFGTVGYYLGINSGNVRNVSKKDLVVKPTPSLAISQTPLTESDTVDSNAELFEPNLVSTTNWNWVSFPNNIRFNQNSESRPGNIVMKIPFGWIKKTLQTRTETGVGGGSCNDFQLSSADGKTMLLLKPVCTSSINDHIPMSGKIQIIELLTKVGDDSHDSFRVRYYDSSVEKYHYGSIAVSPGASIDKNADYIYPYLILQYEPDRQTWLWTSIDLTVKGDPEEISNSLKIVDSIVSTIKLTD